MEKFCFHLTGVEQHSELDWRNSSVQFGSMTNFSSSDIICPCEFFVTIRYFSSYLQRTKKQLLLRQFIFSGHSPGQDCTCPPAFKLDLWRTWESWQQFWVVVSSCGMIWSNFCKDNFIVSGHSPGQDCTRPPAHQLDLWRKKLVLTSEHQNICWTVMGDSPETKIWPPS